MVSLRNLQVPEKHIPWECGPVAPRAQPCHHLRGEGRMDIDERVSRPGDCPGNNIPFIRGHMGKSPPIQLDPVLSKGRSIGIPAHSTNVVHKDCILQPTKVSNDIIVIAIATKGEQVMVNDMSQLSPTMGQEIRKTDSLGQDVRRHLAQKWHR